jgi:ABC-type amino acid transport system permease subunit
MGLLPATFFSAPPGMKYPAAWRNQDSWISLSYTDRLKRIIRFAIGGKMEALDITYGRAARIWWAWTWRSLLIAVVLGVAIGFAIGFFGAAIGFRHTSVVNVVCAGAAGIFAGIWVLAKILKKNFAGFRIVLIKD